jgi:2-aminoadipate transaminase
LMEEAARAGVARASDDLLVTNGCQQALDLLARVCTAPGETVLVEDPVYPGLRQVFERAGARLVGVPVGAAGVDTEALARLAARERPRLIVLTPNFQNPTGGTMPPDARLAALRAAREARCPLVENDIYGELRYTGRPLATLKQLDETGDVIQIKSFSKLAFPGLRTGWVVAPRAVVRRLADAKQAADLHSDQLSQAVLLAFARAGKLETQRARMAASGLARLDAVLSACGRLLPAEAQFTRPEGGMSLWVRLPEPLDAAELLPRAAARGASYLPGRYFAVSRPQAGGLRLSFAGLEPAAIERGVAVLGQVFEEEISRQARAGRPEPAPAIV